MYTYIIVTWIILAKDKIHRLTSTASSTLDRYTTIFLSHSICLCCPFTTVGFVPLFLSSRRFSPINTKQD